MDIHAWLWTRKYILSLCDTTMVSSLMMLEIFFYWTVKIKFTVTLILLKTAQFQIFLVVMVMVLVLVMVLVPIEIEIFGRRGTQNIWSAIKHGVVSQMLELNTWVACRLWNAFEECYARRTVLLLQVNSVTWNADVFFVANITENINAKHLMHKIQKTKCRIWNTEHN